MWRSAVGPVILATLQNGLNLLDIAPYYQEDIVKGLIIIGALGLDQMPWARIGGRLSRPPAPALEGQVS